MDPIEFTCVGADGASHQYETQQHKAELGLGITMQLSGLVIGPITEAIGPMASSLIEQTQEEAQEAADNGEDASVVERLNLGEIIKLVDFSKVAASVQLALQQLPITTIYAVLRYTNRDGDGLIDSLGKPTPAFNDGYRANYLELFRAVWEVCRVNRFFPGLDSFESVAGGALSTLTASISPKQTEAPAAS